MLGYGLVAHAANRCAVASPEVAVFQQSVVGVDGNVVIACCQQRSVSDEQSGDTGGCVLRVTGGEVDVVNEKRRACTPPVA